MKFVFVEGNLNKSNVLNIPNNQFHIFTSVIQFFWMSVQMLKKYNNKLFKKN